MGVIKKQTIVGSILSYVGVVLGFVNTAVLQPLLLSTTSIGVLSMLHTYSNVASALLDQGMVSATLRNFTFFEKKENRNHGYFALLMIGFMVILSITLGLYLLFNDQLKVAGGVRSEILAKYAIWTLPLTAAVSMYNLMDAYLRGLKDAVSGTLYKDVIQRVLVMLAYLGFHLTLLTFDYFVAAYVVAFGVPTLMALIKVYKLNAHSWKVDWEFFSGKVRTDFLKVVGIGALLGVGGTLVRDVDRWMITYQLDLSSTGIYSTAWFFGYVISIPARSLNRIAIAVIAEKWKINALGEIKLIYQKSCIDQGLVGGLLFLGVWLNVDNVMTFLPAEFGPGKWVIFYIGISHLFNMITGVNTSILSTSKDYRWGAYFLGFLLLLTLLTNLWLIPIYGITGAAAASAISLFIYNLLKFAFIWKRHGMQPFNKELFKVVLAIGVVYIASTLFPQAENWVLDFVVRSIGITLLYGLLVLITKVDSDLVTMVKTKLRLK